MDASFEEVGAQGRERGMLLRLLSRLAPGARHGFAALLMGAALVVVAGPAGAQEPDPGVDPGATTTVVEDDSATTSTTVFDGGPIEPTGTAVSCESYNPDATPEGEEPPPDGPCDGECVESVTEDGEEVVVCADSATNEPSSAPTTLVVAESAGAGLGGGRSAGLPDTGAATGITAAAGVGLIVVGAGLRRRARQA